MVTMFKGSTSAFIQRGLGLLSTQRTSDYLWLHGGLWQRNCRPWRGLWLRQCSDLGLMNLIDILSIFSILTRIHVDLVGGMIFSGGVKRTRSVDIVTFELSNMRLVYSSQRSTMVTPNSLIWLEPTHSCSTIWSLVQLDGARKSTHHRRSEPDHAPFP